MSSPRLTSPARPRARRAEDPIAAYEAIKRASLQELEALEVVVQPLNMDAGCRTVAAEDLEAEVEARLDDGGVPLGPSRAARLVIGVTATEAVKDLLCGFTVTVAVQQVVLLLRDTNIMTCGVTWQHAGLGVSPPGRVAEHIRYMLTHILDVFIAHYPDQNPKR